MNYIQAAIREWAWVVGQSLPDRQWLLSDYDSWELNPHYRGPDQLHPEDYDYSDGVDDPNYTVTGCEEESYDINNESSLTQILSTLED